ncbi:MAG: M20/M25/M40 family metallo-hydrolase [Proteobacteria bacterium]|nr:M20/M25/M40 family metallo-hydrolase [Pseudomonadota bacterium]MBU1709310.1 M20/M25/M40 family metallo-hydrolase [Pseudomonadota bacterium]
MAARKIIMILIVFSLILTSMTASNIVTNMPGKSFSGPFEPLSAEEQAIQARLERHIDKLAGEIGERNLLFPENLSLAAAYIENEISRIKLKPISEDYSVNNMPAKNIIAEIIGAELPQEYIVVGAHYDTVAGSPGANDNGSGVAALLEIAGYFNERKPRRTIRFIAFTNEEPPYFLSENMGSRVHAKQCRRRNENIVAMISLETIGCYNYGPGSQNYPFPLSYFYPDQGNFVAFVSNMSSRKLVRTAINSFRKQTKFPSEGVAAPSWIPGIAWSDQWSFWKEGYPAIMVTDTALFRYAHYHASSDTPNKLSYPEMARVVKGLCQVIDDLASTETSMSR